MTATRTRVRRIPLRDLEIEVREQVSAAEEWGIVRAKLIP